MIKMEDKTSLDLLPRKSKHLYLQGYQQFMDWRKTKNFNSFSENVVLEYFTELTKTMKSSTLWKIYSILRTTIGIQYNIDLSNYTKLRAFLKKQSYGYQPKKSKILTAEEVNKFIFEAPDHFFLGSKVALIVGIMGACRKRELYDVKIQHTKDLKDSVLISVPDTKTNTSRHFTITGRLYHIFKKYIDLRPMNANTDKFFLNYQRGHCTKQAVGINKLGGIPKEVAMYLKLPDPQLYTGHCFRRSSATMLVDEDGDVVTFKH